MRIAISRARVSVCGGVGGCGWFLHLMGRPQEGMAEMKRSIEIDPNFPLVYMDLGWHYWDLGQNDKAIEQARKALEINPKFPYAYLLLTMVYSEEGLHTEAIAAGQKAVEAEPELRWGLGIAYARAGRKDAAYPHHRGNEEESLADV